jgi:DNA-binding transcriptional ArsR family regulator
LPTRTRPVPNKSGTAAELWESAPIFAALGDETRLRLVSRLCDDGPMSIASLTRGATVTRQAITKHLRVMEDAGLVRSTRHGRESFWRLDPGRLEELRHNLALISKQWDDALGRLRKFVED